MTDPAPHFDVLGFGAVAVDDLLYVDAYPAAEQKVRVQHRERQCGGLTGTALVAAARLGTRTAYVGLLGDDPLSRHVMSRLEQEGIDFSHRAHADNAQPAHSTIIVDTTADTRTIFSCSEGLVGADECRPDEELIARASVLLVDHHGLPGTLRAIRIARRHGIGVVADFERDPGPPFEQLLAEVDHLILSQSFAKQLTGTDAPADATRGLWNASREAVVVTCGDAGCWYLGKKMANSPVHQPAFEVDVLDTTGCGDVFHGAYAACLARREPLENRVLTATATAAIKAMHRGGQSGIPTGDQVAAFLSSTTTRQRQG